MQTKTVAITGATGFIGKKLVKDCLEAGWDVRILSRNKHKAEQLFPGLDIFEGDLTIDSNMGDFLKNRQVLVNCAGELHDEKMMQKLHLEGTKTLIEAARGQVQHWIQLSSVGVYGVQRQGQVHEDYPMNPIGAYEQTKATSDQWVWQAASEGAFDCTVLRPSNVFGRDMPNDSLRSLIRLIKKRFFFFIGPTGVQFNYVHVNDVSAAIVACIQNPAARNRIYNISNQCTVESFVKSVCEDLGISPVALRIPEWIVRALAQLAGRVPKFPLTASRVDALTVRANYDSSRIAAELGFRPRISVTQGMQEIVASLSAASNT